MLIEKRYIQDMIAHAQAEVPNECCGVLACLNWKIVRLHRGVNAEASPVRYNLDPKDLLRITNNIEDNGWEILGTYHSHTHTEAYPSATDIRFVWPEYVYFIVSLEHASRPYVRAFRIRNGTIQRLRLHVRPDRSH